MSAADVAVSLSHGGRRALVVLAERAEAGAICSARSDADAGTVNSQAARVLCDLGLASVGRRWFPQDGRPYLVHITEVGARVREAMAEVSCVSCGQVDR